MSNLRSVSTIITADGREFTNRKEAQEHQRKVVRMARVSAVLKEHPEAASLPVVEMLATLGDEIIIALWNPLDRGRLCYGLLAGVVFSHWI